MILRKTNTQAKYKNGISYHLLLCFLAENETVSRVPTLKDFFLFKEIFAIARKKKEIQNKRKYEGNFKKLKRIEKTLISS